MPPIIFRDNISPSRSWASASRWWVLPFLLLAIVIASGACTESDNSSSADQASNETGAPLSPEELEAQAISIDRSLMCPVCPSETIDQAQVVLARQMQQIVREQLAQGRTRAEILQFFADRYGDSVLASPPKKGFNLLVWILPPTGLAAGATVLYFVLRSMRRPAILETADEAELELYLDMVDRDLRNNQT